MLQKVENRERIGVIILNVKHGDLLTIDQPPKGNLPLEKYELWDTLGLMPKPFENVRYLLPYGKETVTTGRLNSFRIPEQHWFLYAYSLADTYNKLDLLLSNIPDPWDTVSALISEITQGLSDPKTEQWRPSGRWQNVIDWNHLINSEPLVKEG